MNKIFSKIILTLAFILTFVTFTYAADNKTISIQIDNPQITVDGVDKNIDDNGTTPIIINERTFIPVRALIENLGGQAQWDNATKTAVLTYGADIIRLTVDSNTAYYNGNNVELDTAPAIVNERTMLPVRFIAESFGFKVDWDNDSRTISISEQVAEVSTEETIAITEATTTIAQAEDESNSSKVLVAYFSNTGNTKEVAEKIANAANADIYAIKAKVPYTDDDLNYNNDNCRANIEQNDSSARPEIEGSVENMDDYDVVYIGYPIWWGNCPKIIDTFMESYDFSDKTVIPFCTSGSSGIGTSENTLKSYEANWFSGRRFSSNVSEEDIKAWIDEVNK